MAGYFSNHSQFQTRFANVASSTTTTTTTTTTPPAIPAETRPRPPTSRHFSTSVVHPPHEERERGVDIPAPLAVHPLRNTWVFWFRQQRAPGNKITNYEEGIKKIASFSSVESFWGLQTHLSPPFLHSCLLRITSYPLNRAGGKWIVRLRKGVADRVWEDLVMGVVGDMFDECGTQGEGEEGGCPEICGCTISVRQSEDIVSLWNRVDRDAKVREKIRDTLRTVLNLPPSTIMEYKSNNDSMQDKSSRMPVIADAS
ncbi:translation initiation factor eIF 4e-like domain-containing protein [Suillus subluteus]|nr:translation initiation factor eIF 4e-like domain-containing protein [Suillus subluteus]